ncbi:hypothetical protein phiOC_p090 [Ochrobactrum phage vB_OspM_OC]|nr:hypothetical protein phiOC_p090 [Ochrobactrum phage vB_OspM_OC]
MALYHKDIKIYLSFNYKKDGFVVEKNFAENDSLEEFIASEYRRNHVVVVDKKQNKILVNTQDIFRLQDGGYISEKIGFYTSPKLPFYLTSLIPSFGTFANYLEEVTLTDINSHFKSFATPKNIPYLDHLVYPIYGKVVTTTPDRFIIQTPHDKISVKRAKDLPFVLNDVVCIGTVFHKHKLHYARLFCNITKQTTEFEQGELSILNVNFKDAMH